MRFSTGTILAALVLLTCSFAAEPALAQIGGGGRGPTLNGRNRNSPMVRWWSKSFSRNSRIRMVAEDRIGPRNEVRSRHQSYYRTPTYYRYGSRYHSQPQIIYRRHR
ncbi:hypothetical protein [Stratiformator vulcanicus]|uniref:Secreted protein n=1 Tax=Stratiformator vulcanicus TaxID=2527980 RepID=A0A517R686_9PLAN|nr:hypothetical protein [Stratiformator vulcanicus]QDT39398.1 hypothetical protein Pan189_38050 [Stratiformator vulcanicus]